MTVFILDYSILIVRVVPFKKDFLDQYFSHHLDSLVICGSSETPANSMFSTSHIPTITDHSTPDLNNENMTYLEDTMSEFQSRKDTRKTFVKK